MDLHTQRLADVISLIHTPIYRRLLDLLHRPRTALRDREIVHHAVELMNSTALNVIPMHRTLVGRLRELLPTELRHLVLANTMAPENLDVDPLRLPPIRGRGRRNPRVCPTCRRA